MDLGSGSGRYSCALSLLGAKEVIAVDYGDFGIAKGRTLAQNYGLDNVHFQKESFLDSPFEDESFDFIFCNGTTHHSEDMTKATRELFRVLKKDHCAWCYVYGSGGFFWDVIRSFNDLMQMVNIPKEYAMELLALSGMPNNRHIFLIIGMCQY